MAEYYRVFHTSDVVKSSGLTQRQVIDLCERGPITPSTDATGIGSRRVFNYYNLLEFSFIKSLIDIGIQLHRIKKIVKHLKESPYDFFEAWYQGFDQIYIRKIENFKIINKCLENHPNLKKQEDKRLKSNIKGAHVGLFAYFKTPGGFEEGEVILPYTMWTSFTILPEVLLELGKRHTILSILTVDLGLLKDRIDRMADGTIITVR